MHIHIQSQYRPNISLAWPLALQDLQGLLCVATMLWRLWQWGETSTHHLVLTFVSDLHLMPVRVASNTDRERVLGARGECELVRKFGASWPTVAHCGPLWPKVINYQCSNQ